MSEFITQKIKEIKARLAKIEELKTEEEQLRGALEILEKKPAPIARGGIKKPVAKKRTTKRRKPYKKRALLEFDEKIRDFINAHPDKKYTPSELFADMKLPAKTRQNLIRTLRKIASHGHIVFEKDEMNNIFVSSTKNATKETMKLSLTTTGLTKDEARDILSGEKTVAGQT